MSVKIESREAKSEQGILNDPGNMLIICYVAVIFFFILLGVFGAVKYPSGSSGSPSTVSSEISKTFFQLI